jgi:hypothetical protein
MEPSSKPSLNNTCAHAPPAKQNMAMSSMAALALSAESRGTENDSNYLFIGKMFKKLIIKFKLTLIGVQRYQFFPF